MNKTLLVSLISLALSAPTLAVIHEKITSDETAQASDLSGQPQAINEEQSTVSVSSPETTIADESALTITLSASATPASEVTVSETPVVTTAAPEATVVEMPVVTTAAPEATAVEMPVVATAAPEATVVEMPVVTTAAPEATVVEMPVVTTAAPEAIVVEMPVVTTATLEATVVEMPVVATAAPEVAVVEIPAAENMPEQRAVISFVEPTEEKDKSDIAKVLDVFHNAASSASWQTYFEQMNDDAVFIGTDAKERWNKAEFMAYADTRQSGWSYRPLERSINFTPDGKTAWFDEILESQTYGVSRGTGVLTRTDNGWKISQYHLTLPIPNELAEQVTTEIKNFEKSNETLNTFHQAAADANWSLYFNQMSNDAVFIGTDAKERWSKAAFEAYVNSRKTGWVYSSKSRNIKFANNGLTAWFDEILDSKNYGTSRGTGVLINTNEGWKISQYHLTFPIPNALAGKFTEQFKLFEQQRNTAKAEMTN